MLIDTSLLGFLLDSLLDSLLLTAYPGHQSPLFYRLVFGTQFSIPALSSSPLPLAVKTLLLPLLRAAFVSFAPCWVRIDLSWL